MRTIICIDGGGAKGSAPAEALLALEKAINRPLHQVVDLFVGTSAGSILGAIFASGRMTAEKAVDVFSGTLPEVFKKRMRWPNTPKYSRDPVRNAFQEHLGNLLMRDCKTKFMSTAVNACDSRTHYFKSWEEHKDGILPLIDVVERSFSAPLFFGGIVDVQSSALWLDGGTGADNCPVLQAIQEAIIQGWLIDDSVHILSIGCGHAEDDMPWEEAQRSGNLAQIMYFADPKDGGLARRQATAEVVGMAQSLEAILPNFTFQRLDFGLTREQDAMDRVDLMPLYKCKGIEMGRKIEISPFLK